MSDFSKVTKAVFRRITPFEELKSVRSEFLVLFQNLYTEDIDVQNSFRRLDNPSLAKKASQSGRQAMRYNPISAVEGLLGWANFAQSLIIYALFFCLVLSVLFGLAISPILKQWISFFGAPLSFLPMVVVASILLYLGFLRRNRDALQAFNEQLAMSQKEINRHSRDRPKLVSYYIWNEVLKGQTIPTLACFFFLLEEISKLPLIRRYLNSPTQFILGYVLQYRDIIINGDGYLDAIQKITKIELEKLREQRREVQ